MTPEAERSSPFAALDGGESAAATFATKAAGVAVARSRRPSDAPRRVLFVDDEADVLDGLRRVLRGDRGVFDAAFALGGEAAIVELSRATYDVVVADLRMPGVDGAELLSFARAKSPETIRFVLTGHGSKEDMARARLVAHRIFQKPCAAVVLRDELRRALDLGRILAASPDGADDLDVAAVVPEVFKSLSARLDSGAADPAEVATLVASDAAFARALVGLSPALLDDVAEEDGARAVALKLGIDGVRRLAAPAAVFSSFAAIDAATFSLELRHAAAIARIAATVASAGPSVEVARLVALLHDVGRLVFASRRSEAFAAFERRAGDGRRYDAASDRATFGTEHAHAGARLLAAFDAPYSVVEAVARHHDPVFDGAEAAATDPRAAVVVAEALFVEATARGAARDEASRALLRLVDPSDPTGVLARWRACAAAAKRAM
jgi:putative nucleotidyltransferase with HDIG domain